MEIHKLVRVVGDLAAEGNYQKAAEEVLSVADDISKCRDNIGDIDKSNVLRAAQLLLNASRTLAYLGTDEHLVQMHKESIERNKQVKEEHRKQDECCFALIKIIEEIFEDRKYLQSLTESRYQSFGSREYVAEKKLKEYIEHGQFPSPQEVGENIALLCDKFVFMGARRTFGSGGDIIKAGCYKEFELRRIEMNSRRDRAMVIMEDLIKICQKNEEIRYESCDMVRWRHGVNADEKMKSVYMNIKNAQFYLDKVNYRQ